MTELMVLLAALCFVCIRTDYVRRGAFLGMAIIFWGLAQFLTELNYGRAQYDASYTYGTLISYLGGFAMVGSLLFLAAACWRPSHKKPSASPVPATPEKPEEAAPVDPSERLRELLSDDR